MAATPRRVLARYPCDIPVEVLSFISETLLAQGRFVNLSIGGALLNVASPMERGITYFFRFSWGSAVYELPGRLAWVAPRVPGYHRYGIEFNLTRDQESFLRGIVETLRSAAQPPAGGMMRDYWKPRSKG